MLNSMNDWHADFRDTIYRKRSKQKKLTSATLEAFNVLPQVKQLDAEFAKGIDGVYRIKRVKTYEDFVAICCEFYVDPASYQNSLCYIVETDNGYLYLMVVERDNSVANFGVGFDTVIVLVFDIPHPALCFTAGCVIVVFYFFRNHR